MNTSISNQLDPQKGVDIRPSSTAIFGISSVDRYSSLAVKNSADASTYPASDLTISSKQPFIQGAFQRIGLTEAVLRWTLPTLTFNNRRINIAYQPGGVGPITVYTVIPSSAGSYGGAWYTPTTLAAALQTAVRTATGNVAFTVVANATTGAFTAATNTTAEFQFRPYVDPSAPNRIGLFEMMNWETYGDDALLATEIISGIPSMLRTQFVDFVCSQLTGCQGVKDADTGSSTRDVLCRLYLNDGLTQDPELLGSQPFTLHRQFSVPKQIKWLPNTSVGGYLKFELYDDQGYIITGGDPAFDAAIGEWNITLQLSEV